MDTFEEALCRLDKHIWYMAHRFGKSIQDQDVDDLHQEGVIKLYEIYSSAKYTSKDPTELDYIFKGALYNLMRDIYSVSKRKRPISLQMTIQIEEFESGTYDAFIDVYLAQYKSDLAKRLSQDAALLLDLLLEPTPAVYHMYNIQVMRRKALRSQGMNVRIPTKITHEIVGGVLGFSLAKTKNLIRELKDVWDTECQRAITKSKRSAVLS